MIGNLAPLSQSSAGLTARLMADPLLLVIDRFPLLPDLVLLAVGILFLYLGAEALVESVSTLALGAGIDAALIGVTVIAFATTTPELFVGLIGALAHSSQLGLGAVIGSNIANIGLVLGAAAVIRPFEVNKSILKRHVPFMLLAATLLIVLGLDSTISRPDGIVFLLLLAFFTWYLYRGTGDTEVVEAVDVDAEEATVTYREVGFFFVGLLLLFLGSRSLIIGGKGILESFGFGTRIIGLTILAFGTSLPELATSVVSAVRKNGAFSLGNVVGSNIYNILAVIGVIALIVPLEVSPATIGFDFPALLVFSAGIFLLLSHDSHVSRADGTILLGSYATFFVLLV